MLDCIIVGAGVSGLVAARELVRRGQKLVVLEARDRIGGRTLSTSFGQSRLDLGGQWIGPRQPHIGKLVRELGLATFPQYHDGKKLIDRNGRRHAYRGPVPLLAPHVLIDLVVATQRLERYGKRLRDGRGEAAWDATSLETWLVRAMRTEGGRDVVRTMARAVLAAEPAEMSLYYFVDYIRRGHSLREVLGVAGGAQETRIVLGMQSVSERLAAELPDRVRLSEPVLAIEQSDRDVTVRTAGATYRARHVVITVPPSLCDRIHFGVALPARRVAATDRVTMGSAIKFLVQYARPFWREAGLSGEATSDRGVLEMTFDACSADGSVAALVGFSLGAAARRMQALGREGRQRAVVGELTALFGAAAAHPLRYEERSWLDDPWSRGCYVGVAPCGVGDLRRVLREPCGRIHWAGGETAEDWPGVDGAVFAGYRVAAEIGERIAEQGAAA